MGEAIPKGSVVYIRYREHIPFRNNVKTINVAAERETLGWLTQEIGDYVCIQNDRTPEKLQYSNGSASGIVLRKSCILEMHAICEEGERIETGSPVHHYVS
jgi:hypothetical protein